MTDKTAGIQSGTRAEEISRQIQSLSSRDLQLWSISILVILVLAAGFLSTVLPGLGRSNSIVQGGDRYLPQFFYGLIALVVLFNIYVMSQKRTLNATRLELIRELVLNEKLDSVSLVDPLTQLLSRRSLDLVVSRDVARANRLGSSLTFLLLSIDSLNAVTGRFGSHAAEEFTLEVAKLVKDTFRGSDTVLRYRAAEFLIVMPDTTEQQAEYALRRLQAVVDQWNVTTKTGWEIALSQGMVPYVAGTEISDMIRAAERTLSLKQQPSAALVPYSAAHSSRRLPV